MPTGDLRKGKTRGELQNYFEWQRQQVRVNNKSNAHRALRVTLVAVKGNCRGCKRCAKQKRKIINTP